MYWCQLQPEPWAQRDPPVISAMITQGGLYYRTISQTELTLATAVVFFIRARGQWIGGGRDPPFFYLCPQTPSGWLKHTPYVQPNKRAHKTAKSNT